MNSDPSAFQPSSFRSSGTLVLRSSDPWLVARDRFLDDSTPEERVLFTYANPENLFYKTSNDEQVDRNTSKVRGISRSLEPLIDVIQEYGKAMDVYSNASPSILCPLWGSIRVLLVLAQSYGKFFDLIVEELQHIGEVLPRFSLYIKLYPHHESLRQALSTAYLDIIRICTRYRDFLREQKPVRKFLVPLSTRATKNFKSSVENFRRHEKNVRMEVDICHMIEAKQTSEMLQADRKREMDELREQKFQRLLKVLSPINIEETHERIRRFKHPKSCRWIFSSEEYQSWINLDKSAVLCCYGIPGCGKSVLASSIIDALKSSNSKSPPIIYYYCDYAEKVSLEPTIILGTLIRGLLSRSGNGPEISDLIQKTYHDGERTPDMNEVLGILLKVMEISNKAVLVLDGIDELDEKNFYVLLSSLQILLSHPGVLVKIFLTSRECKDIISILSPSPQSWFQIHLDQSVISNDIDCYIRHSVDQLMASKRSIINSSHTEVKNEILRRLIEGANGMFLWVKYQLDELYEPECEESLMNALRNLPKDLDETYERLLNKIITHSERELLTRRMFQWIIAARRPLSEGELCEGMAFTIDDHRWNPKKIPPNLSRIIRAGGNLVVFDKTTEKIRFAHYTVRQYLLRERPLSKYQFSIEKADEELAEVCIAYLSFDDFERQVARFVDNGVNAAMKPLEMITNPTSPNKSLMNPLVIRHRLGLSRDISSLDINHSRHISPRTSSPPVSFNKFALLEYAKTHWLFHSTGFKSSKISSKQGILLYGLLMEKRLPFIFKPWPDNYSSRPYPDLVGWAIVNNHATLIKVLMEYDHQFSFKDCIEKSAEWFFTAGEWFLKDYDKLMVSETMLAMLTSSNFDIWNPNISTNAWIYHKLVVAARNGNIGILELLAALFRDEFPWECLTSHLLFEAAGSNQHSIVDLFAFSQTNLHFVGFKVETEGQVCNALERAALSGHIALVKKLGDMGWAPSNIFDVESAPGFVALDNAIFERNTRIAEALITALKFIERGYLSLDEIVTNVYLKAISSGFIELVDICLSHGFDPTGPNKLGICPYMQAIQDGQFEIFCRFFSVPGCGVKMNRTGSPLGMAVAHDRIEMVEFLISNGASLDGTDPADIAVTPRPFLACPTPLYFASAKGNYAIVRLLLNSGANLNARSYSFRQVHGANPYHPELPIFPLEMFYMSAKLELDSKNTWQVALTGAAWNGHLEVVQLLVSAGASVNPPKSDGDHPLILAAMCGHSQVVDFLLSNGAKLHVKERESGEAILACSRGYGEADSLPLLVKCGMFIQCTDLEGRSGIHLAVVNKLPAILKQLIDLGGDVDAEGKCSMTPIMEACLDNNFGAAETLMEAGADLTKRDIGGLSALSFAIRCQNFPIVKLLLNYGELVELASPDGKTPLIEAAEFGHVEAFFYLIKRGANLNVRSEDKSLLYYAVWGRNSQIIMHLIHLHEEELRANGRGLFSLEDLNRPQSINYFPCSDDVHYDVLSKLETLIAGLQS